MVSTGHPQNLQFPWCLPSILQLQSSPKWSNPVFQQLYLKTLSWRLFFPHHPLLLPTPNSPIFNYYFAPMTKTNWPILPHLILSMATWTLAVSVWSAKHPCFQSGYPLLQCLAIPSRFLKLPTVDLALMSSTTYHATLAVSIVSRPITLAGQALPTQQRKPWLADGLTIRVTSITTMSSHPIFYGSTEEKIPNSLSLSRFFNQPLTWKRPKFLRKSGL